MIQLCIRFEGRSILRFSHHNQVISEFGFYRAYDLAHLGLESRLLESRYHLSTAEKAEIASLVLAGARREALGDFVKLLPLLDLLLQIVCLNFRGNKNVA